MQAADPLAVATAIVILTAGVAAIAGYAIGTGRRQGLLLSFGVFGAVYGVRIFSKQPLAVALGMSRASAAWGESTLNYVILIPSFLFGQELYGQGWRGVFRWILAEISAYAAIAIVADVVTGNPGFAPDPSNALLLAVAIASLAGARAGY
jgi:hypothetical protein